MSTRRESQRRDQTDGNGRVPSRQVLQSFSAIAMGLLWHKVALRIHVHHPRSGRVAVGMLPKAAHLAIRCDVRLHTARSMHCRGRFLFGASDGAAGMIDVAAAVR